MSSNIAPYPYRHGVCCLRDLAILIVSGLMKSRAGFGLPVIPGLGKYVPKFERPPPRVGGHSYFPCVILFVAAVIFDTVRGSKWQSDTRARQPTSIATTDQLTSACWASGYCNLETDWSLIVSIMVLTSMMPPCSQ